MSNFTIDGENADEFIAATYAQISDALLWDIFHPDPFLAGGEAQLIEFSAAFQKVADHLHDELMPLYRGIDTPEVDYSRLDHRRAYLLYYVAPYAAQLGYWISEFGVEEVLNEFMGKIVLIGTGPSPEMIALEYLRKKRGWDGFSYYCIDINGAWDWNCRRLSEHAEPPINYALSHFGGESTYEFHTADVSNPTCWANLPINFSEVDLVVCQNFLNEIGSTMAEDFQESLATVFDSLSEGSSLLFSDLKGYDRTYPIPNLEEFWSEHAFTQDAEPVTLLVDIPSQSFPSLLGPLQDSKGRRMDSFWRKKRLKATAKRVVKTEGTSAVENYKNFGPRGGTIEGLFGD